MELDDFLTEAQCEEPFVLDASEPIVKVTGDEDEIPF